MNIQTNAETRPTLHMQRVFDAPRELLWAAWTRPEMLVLWLGPAEWPAISTTQDLRVGGQWRAGLKRADGDDLLWQSGIYREVTPPERLVFTFKWEDASHEDGAPAETLVTVVFSALPDGRTRMDFTHEGLKSAESLSGHKQGWTSTFDRLQAWLETQS
jgi:uncharacterized protein YndB with AHSA1/START domain